MKALGFSIRYALRSLLRGGQRTVLALACIAFGVMSLISLQTLADMVHASLVPDPHLLTGGDEMVARFTPLLQPNVDMDGKPAPIREQFSPSDLEQLDSLKSQGVIAGYTLQADRQVGVLKPDGSASTFFVSRVMGIDPATYPLVGTLQLAGQTGDVHTLLAMALKDPHSAAISRDLAEQLGLQVGSPFSLVFGPGLPVAQFRVGAILQVMPDRRGSTVLFSLATARQISGWQDVANIALILNGPNGDAVKALSATGWTIYRSQDMATAQRTDNVVQVFTFMLRAAGILGLMLGGIGVSNTIQVLLSRRTQEIAILKTSGYPQGRLLAMFGIEIGLLGLVGSGIGTLAAFGVSSFLVGLVQTLLTDTGVWAISPALVAGGMLAGTATSLVLSAGAILQASQVRPAMLMRDNPVSGQPVSRYPVGVYALLAIFFVGLASLAVDSLLLGLAVVAGSMIGLGALGLLFGVVLSGVVHMPLPPHRLLGMARTMLSRERRRSLYALVALFCGVFTIGFASTAITSAVQRALDSQHSFNGSNLWVYTTMDAGSQAMQSLAAQGAQPGNLDYDLLVQIHIGDRSIHSVLDGRSAEDYASDYQLLAPAAWDSSPDAVYLPQSFSLAPWYLKPGGSLSVTTVTGQVVLLRIAGFYKAAQNQKLHLNLDQSLLVNGAAVQRLGNPATMVIVNATGSPDRYTAASAAINRAHPGQIAFSNGDATVFVNRRFWELVDLVYAVAGLSLLAGAILIANSTSLAMIERRREMGVLKAVGFSAGQVLQMILIENGLMGMVAGMLGMAGVAVAIPILNRLQPALRMHLDGGLVAGMIALAVLFALGSAGLVAWRPTHAHPMDVLRQE